MSFLDKINQLDRELFIYLNSLGIESWDGFWILVTNQFTWIPLFAFFLFLVYRAYGLQKSLVIIVLMALLIAFSDQFVNLIKNYFIRLRPNNEESLMEIIRILKRPRSFSFVSGHATTSFAVSMFLFKTLKEHYKHAYLIFLWPFIFAYSRIYVGVHYPLDIFTGMLLGLLIGFIFYRISVVFLQRSN